MILWHMFGVMRVNVLTINLIEAVLSCYFRRVEVYSPGHFFTAEDEPVYISCTAVADLN